jgi:hypothetical protein
MFKPVRVVATIVFLASIGLVLVGAFVLHNGVRVDRFLIGSLLNTFHDSGAVYQ